MFLLFITICALSLSESVWITPNTLSVTPCLSGSNLNNQTWTYDSTTKLLENQNQCVIATGNSNPVQTTSCDSSNTNLQWIYNNNKEFISVSKKTCLDIYGGKPGITSIDEYTCKDTTNQQWIFDTTTKQIKSVAFPTECLTATTSSTKQLYDVELYSMSTKPVISFVNAIGKGHTPCNYTFNPSYVPASATVKTPGVLLRVAQCPESYGGATDHIMWAPCDLISGLCSDLQQDIVVGGYTQDPRIVYDESTGIYYNFYWAGNHNNHGAATLDFAIDVHGNPYNSSSWNMTTILPWNRNGCLIIRKTLPHYVLYGISNGALHGWLGVATTEDFMNFTTINSTFLAPDSTQSEVVIEAGSPPILIPKTGDYFHLYAAGTQGWNSNPRTGNYTSGYLILDGNNPNNIIQKSTKHILIPTYPYQIGEGAPYPTQNNRTIFAPTAVNLPKTFANDTDVWDYVRVWFGALDANVGTAVIRIKKN